MFDDPFIKVLAITFVVLAFIFGFILFGYFIYKYNRTGSKKYNFLTYFPFELNGYRRHASSSFIDVSLMIVTYLLLIVPVVIFAIFSNLPSSYIMLAVYIFALTIFACLFFTKLSAFKLHVSFACIFVCLEVLYLLLSLTYYANENSAYVINDEVRIIITIFIILQIIFEIILIVNPSIKDWAKKVRIDAETFSRPKYNYLAMLEWGTFLNFLLNYIVLILVSFF